MKKLVIILILLLVIPLVLATPPSLQANTNQGTNNPEYPEVFDPIGFPCTVDPSKSISDRIGSSGDGRRHCYVFHTEETTIQPGRETGVDKDGVLRECTRGEEDEQFYNYPPTFISGFDGNTYNTARGYELASAECDRHSGGDPRAFCGEDYKCHLCKETGTNNPTCAIKAEGYFPEIFQAKSGNEEISNACLEGKYNGQTNSCYFCAPVEGTGSQHVNILMYDSGGKSVQDIINEIKADQPFGYLIELGDTFTFNEVKGEVPNFQDILRVRRPTRTSNYNYGDPFEEAFKLMDKTCDNQGINIVVDDQFVIDGNRRAIATSTGNCDYKRITLGNKVGAASHELGHAYCELADEYEHPIFCFKDAPNIDSQVRDKRETEIDSTGNPTGNLVNVCNKFEQKLGGNKGVCYKIFNHNPSPVAPGGTFYSSTPISKMKRSSVETESIDFNLVSCIACMEKADVNDPKGFCEGFDLQPQPSWQ